MSTLKIGENNNNNLNNLELIYNAKYFELENKYNILIKKFDLKNCELLSIKKEYESLKKINLRTKELFGKKAGEYRERIYQMTGYNICLLGDGKTYRLKYGHGHTLYIF